MSLSKWQGITMNGKIKYGKSVIDYKIIKSKISPHAQIIWGAAVKEELEDELRVMLVLTGVKSEQIHGASENRQLRALRNQQIEFVN